MKTVLNQPSVSFREKGSKFIGYLFPAPSVASFEDELTQIKSKHPDATHHCYAWRMDPTNIEEFAQDDGEPSGTAGLPILNQLKSFDMVNAGCVVVRYYGGTNLGKSGLIQAYGHAAQLCLEAAELATLIATQNFEICYPYAAQSRIDKLKSRFDLKEITAEYLEEVTLEIACRSEQADQFWEVLQNLKHRGIVADQLGSSFVTMQS